MIPAYSYDQICYELKDKFTSQQPTGSLLRMTGLLFARPTSPLAQSEIVPNLNYFHRRSGKNIDFFCAGYGAYWPAGWVPDAQPVATIDNTPWQFSDDLFLNFVNEIENSTTWHYSGEVDLLLTNAQFDQVKQVAKLDFASIIVCRLDLMRSDGTITSVGSYFEKIFKYAQNQLADDPTWGFGDQESSSMFAESLKSLALSLIPMDIGKNVDKNIVRLSHFWLRNVGKKSVK